MISEPNTIFKEGCEIAFDEEHWQKMNYSTGCYEQNFAKGKVSILKNSVPIPCVINPC